MTDIPTEILIQVTDYCSLATLGVLLQVSWGMNAIVKSKKTRKFIVLNDSDCKLCYTENRIIKNESVKSIIGAYEGIVVTASTTSTADLLRLISPVAKIINFTFSQSFDVYDYYEHMMNLPTTASVSYELVYLRPISPGYWDYALNEIVCRHEGVKLRYLDRYEGDHLVIDSSNCTLARLRCSDCKTKVRHRSDILACHSCFASICENCTPQRYNSHKCYDAPFCRKCVEAFECEICDTVADHLDHSVPQGSITCFICGYEGDTSEEEEMYRCTHYMYDPTYIGRCLTKRAISEVLSETVEKMKSSITMLYAIENAPQLEHCWKGRCCSGGKHTDTFVTEHGTIHTTSPEFKLAEYFVGPHAAPALYEELCRGRKNECHRKPAAAKEPSTEKYVSKEVRYRQLLHRLSCRRQVASHELYYSDDSDNDIEGGDLA
jgi:hypothetical protein